MTVPNLSALRAFEAAARKGSFKAAALELNVTPAAISRSVRRLEEELGLVLFHRSHRAVSLTAEGARYAQRVSDGFRHFARNGIDTASRRPGVILQAEATFVGQWLLPRLGAASFDALNLSLTIQTHHDPPRLIPPGADLAIVHGFTDYGGFKRNRLATPRTLVAAAPSLGVAALEDVAAAGLIHEANDHWWRLTYSEAGLAYPGHANALTLHRCDLPIVAARHGLGVAIVDDVIAEPELRSGALAAVAAPRFDGQAYFLLTRVSAAGPARSLAAWLLEEARRFAEWQATEA